MMKVLSNLIRNTPDNILLKSRANCHVKGLYSIVLGVWNGRMVRMFYCEPFHQLYKDTSLAYHTNHCGLIMEVLVGVIYNSRLQENNLGFNSKLLSDTFGNYEWSSMLDREVDVDKVGFKPLQSNIKLFKDHDTVTKGKSVHLGASEIHTVFAPKNREAAWLVYEGEEDPDYEHIAYSQMDLEKWTPDGLYKEMTLKEIKKVIDRVEFLFNTNT